MEQCIAADREEVPSHCVGECRPPISLPGETDQNWAIVARAEGAGVKGPIFVGFLYIVDRACMARNFKKGLLIRTVL